MLDRRFDQLIEISHLEFSKRDEFSMDTFLRAEIQSYTSITRHLEFPCLEFEKRAFE